MGIVNDVFSSFVHCPLGAVAEATSAYFSSPPEVYWSVNFRVVASPLFWRAAVLKLYVLPALNTELDKLISPPFQLSCLPVTARDLLPA